MEIILAHIDPQFMLANVMGCSSALLQFWPVLGVAAASSL